MGKPSKSDFRPPPAIIQGWTCVLCPAPATIGMWCSPCGHFVCWRHVQADSPSHEPRDHRRRYRAV